MVLEITLLLEYIRITKTADFKNSINPRTPAIQSDANILAPPFILILKLYVKKKIKVPDLTNLF